MATQRKSRRCVFCKRTAAPRGWLPLCRKHGGGRPITKGRRRRYRKRIEWENSQSVWKAQQRRKARVEAVRARMRRR